MEGIVDERGARGTISYAEVGESHGCEGTLSWAASGLPTPCVDCEWSIAVATTAADVDGECDFGVIELSMMPDPNEATYFAYRENYAADGENYDRYFSYVAEDGAGGVAIYPLYREVDGAVLGGPAWSPGTGELAFEGGPVEGEAPTLSRECVDLALPVSRESFLGDAPQEESLPCGDARVADRWTIFAEAGQVLGLSADTDAQAPLEIRVVAPDGCDEAASVTGLTCTGGGDCPSLEYTIPGTGTWGVLVSTSRCTSDVRYVVGGRLQ